MRRVLGEGRLRNGANNGICPFDKAAGPLSSVAGGNLRFESHGQPPWSAALKAPASSIPPIQPPVV